MTENERIINEFLDDICHRFPEMKSRMDRHDECLPTSRMEEFARATTEAIASGNTQLASDYLNYMNRKLSGAHAKELEYIDVYYVECLFWQADRNTRQTGWPLVPPKLQKMYVDFHGKQAI